MRNSPSEIESLCSELEQSTKLKKSGKCIKFTNKVNNSELSVDSWKFLDWDYGKEKVKLPIQARGLFTLNNERIVVRGYDKFFNVGEKSFTKEESLKSNTTGPYEVTLKENGCIIFISGIDDRIVVCSKHSTGQRDESMKNHALEGEVQLRNQLGDDDDLSRLATYLSEHNLTAVAELCDDEFEEHVLSYPKGQSGLYLHGLNYNTIDFNTVPITKVEQFAAKWNFKMISHLSFSNVDNLFEFLHKCSETGTYNHKEVEGFVIRCKRLEQDFFFKYKFEEPYLLYRQFREATRQLLEGVPIDCIRMKKNKTITRRYLEFANDLFTTQPELKSQYLDGHGIIKVRQLFLENIHETNGMNLLSLDDSSPSQVKYVIIPVATIGCGKTTVFTTLAKLFNWPHIQNDNISRKAKLKITDLTLQALDNNSVVLFDRNNSEYRERRQIFQTIQTRRNNYIDEDIVIKYIGLNFINDVTDEQLWNVTFSRIKSRGDNHQSIQFNKDEKLVTNVMKGFINRYQPINTLKEPDSNFDLVIDLNLDSSLQNVNTIIKLLHNEYPELLKIPSEKEIEHAFNSALEYKPTFIKQMAKVEPQYYGISIDKSRIMNSLIAIEAEEDYKSLVKKEYIQDQFHVTLAHIANSKENKAKWKNIVKKLGYGESKEGLNLLNFFADVKLLQIVINRQKLICIKIELIKIKSVDIEPLNSQLHVTIGCFPPNLAYQSNATLEELYKDGNELKPDGIYKINDDVLKVVNIKEEPLIDQQLFVFI